MGIGFNSEENMAHNQRVLDGGFSKTNPPYSLEGYIERQELLSNLKFGVKDSAYGGCGWIAAWNVLKSENIVLNEAYIISVAEKYLLASGLLGMKPSGIVSFLKKLGHAAKMFTNTDSFLRANPKRGIIYTMAKNMRAHYVGFNEMGKTSAGETLYVFHNAGRRVPSEWVTQGGKKYTEPKPITLKEYLEAEDDLCVLLYKVD